MLASWVVASIAALQAPPASAVPEPATLRLVPDDVALASDDYLGADGRKHRDPLELRFDDDVVRVAIVGWSRGHVFGLADDVEVNGFDFLTAALVPRAGQPVRFRAGSRTGKRSEKWSLVVDGKKTTSEDWIGAIGVSRDGASCGFWVEPGAKLDENGFRTRGPMHFVFDGRRGATWDDAEALAEPQFTRDGDKVATAAMKAGKWRVLVVSKRGEVALESSFAALGDFAWRPDGAELAYAADEFERDYRNPRTERGATHSTEQVFKFRIVVGAEKSGFGGFADDFDECGDPVWTPDGKSVVYKMAKEQKLGVARDGKEWVAPFASALATPVVSPDGKRVAVAARVGNDTIDRLHSLRRGSDLLAPDEHWVLSLDGKSSAEWQRVADPVFSPDGSTVAYAAKRADHWLVAIGEQRTGEFDAVGPPHFTADGAHVVFGARRGREVRREVVAVAPPAETKPEGKTSK